MSQKEQILRWWIPALLSSLKKSHGLSVLYMEEPLAVDSKKNWFYVDRKICFPLFVKDLSIGCVVSLSPVTSLEIVQDIRHSIDFYLYQISSWVFLHPPPSLSEESRQILPVYSGSPLLIRGRTEKEIIQKSHKLYLKTDHFAFLVMNEEEWLKTVSLGSMDGVFICIPSFYKLSVPQKRILKKEFKKPLSCSVSLGLIEPHVLPSEWESFFIRPVATSPFVFPV